MVALESAWFLAREARGEEGSGGAAVACQHRGGMSNEASGDGAREDVGDKAAMNRRGVGLVREVAVDVEPQELGKMSRRS